MKEAWVRGAVERMQSAMVKRTEVVGLSEEPRLAASMAEVGSAALDANPLRLAKPMTELDRLYLEQRAETELLLAQAAAHPSAVRAHYLMASCYLDRLHFQEEESSGPA